MLTIFIILYILKRQTVLKLKFIDTLEMQILQLYDSFLVKKLSKGKSKNNSFQVSRYSDQYFRRN